jgi:pyruvate dehydrogenase E1 component
LAKTVKGYGLGEAGEGRNISHQQKKMNEKELREFRDRFDVPIRDEDVVETPFYRPPKDSPETKYLLQRRKELGGFVPKRVVVAEPLRTPRMELSPNLQRFRHGRRFHDQKFCPALVQFCCATRKLGRRSCPSFPTKRDLRH